MGTYVSDAIRGAQKGSVLYGVVEKMAYNLHVLHPGNDADHNWFTAQGYLERFLSHRYVPCVMPSVSELVSTMIDNGRRLHEETRTPVTDIAYRFSEMVVSLNERGVLQAA